MDSVFFFNFNIQLRTNETISLSNSDLKDYLIKPSNIAATSGGSQRHNRHFTPMLTLEFFNYIMALVLFMLRYSSTFWHLSKVYSLVFSVHLFLYACMSALILCTFDILYKYETLFAKGIHLSLKNNTRHEQVLVRLPFVTNLPSLMLTFFLSVTLLFVSCLPIYAFGIKEYKASFRKLQNHFNTYIQNKNLCKIIINQTYVPTMTAAHRRAEYAYENEEAGGGNENRLSHKMLCCQFICICIGNTCFFY